MCFVLDVNTFHCVFDTASRNHERFRPVYEWLFNGRGKMVMGGSKYDEEISRMPKYIKLLSQLRRSKKIVRANDADVDRRADEIARECNDQDFDDQHLVALLAVSECRLFCSEDQRSYKYVKMKKWYSAGVPRIYRSKSFGCAKHILSDRHAAEICKPCNVLNREAREALVKACG